jgi:hypothetical protein
MTTQTAFDLIFRRAVTQSSATPVDIGVKAGRIAAVAPHLDGEASRSISADGWRRIRSRTSRSCSTWRSASTQTERRKYQGRVAIRHATKLSALPPDALKTAAARLASAGVAVTVLPATDLYLMGRQATHNTPRGLTAAHRLVKPNFTLMAP